MTLTQFITECRTWFGEDRYFSVGFELIHYGGNVPIKVEVSLWNGFDSSFIKGGSLNEVARKLHEFMLSKTVRDKLGDEEVSDEAVDLLREKFRAKTEEFTDKDIPF